MSHWYDQYLPKVGDLKEPVDKIAKQIKSIDGVKKVYVFGSYAANINNADSRVKDIDLIAVVPFHSEDLVAINKDTLSSKTEYLEENGYDLQAVNFSKQFNKTGGLEIDRWAISSDKKLLHWGPIIACRQESDDVKGEAEQRAAKETGFNLSKINKSSSQAREEWFHTFKRYIDSHIADMPSGWYCSDETNIKDIMNEAIKLV